MVQLKTCFGWQDLDNGIVIWGVIDGFYNFVVAGVHLYMKSFDLVLAHFLSGLQKTFVGSSGIIRTTREHNLISGLVSFLVAMAAQREKPFILLFWQVWYAFVIMYYCFMWVWIPLVVCVFTEKNSLRCAHTRLSLSSGKQMDCFTTPAQARAPILLMKTSKFRAPKSSSKMSTSLDSWWCIS